MKRVRQSKNVLIKEMSWEPLPQRHMEINTFLNINKYRWWHTYKRENCFLSLLFEEKIADNS